MLINDYSGFEWDSEKAESNYQKHGISFEEAMFVWKDVFGVVFFDDEHSIDEDRYVLIGMSNRNRILSIAFTEREDRVRIINCRKATGVERALYE